MTLTVRVPDALRSAGTGSEYHFDDDKSPIIFGRSITSDVQFPDHLTKLGRKHFELRHAAGGFELVTDLEHPVYVNGKRVVGTLTLRMPSTITLVDQVGGPEITFDHQKNLPGSVTLEDALQPGSTVHGRLDLLHRTGRVAAVFFTLGLVGVAGYIFYETQQRKSLEQSMFARTTEVLTAIENAERPPEEGWNKVYDSVVRSVYQIVILPADGGRPQPLGTAWVYDAHRLVTNAHVANKFANIGQNQQMAAISSGEMHLQIPVKGVKLHPAYRKFQEIVGAYGPAASDQQSEVCADSIPSAIAQVGSYDIALLEMGGGAELGKPLSLSNGGSENGPTIGTEIAYIGYPAEHAKFKSQILFKTGVISGYSDFSGVSRNGANDLIYHSASAAGGASGSPIFNKHGNVVAVLSGGEMQPADNGLECAGPGEASTKISADPLRRISGSGTFYSQNADLIAQIDHGLTERELGDLQSQWKSSSLYSSRMSEVLAMIDSYKNIESQPEIDEPEVAVSELLRTDGLGKSSVGHLATTKDLEAGTYVAFGFAKANDRLTLQVRSSDGSLETPIYVDSRPVAVFSLERPNSVTFAISGPVNVEAVLRVLRLSD